jgi:hypothetical protein
MVNEVAVDVVSGSDPTNGHLLKLIGTEYSRESPSRVSPYTTLWMTSLGNSSVGKGVVLDVFRTALYSSVRVCLADSLSKN